MADYQVTFTLNSLYTGTTEADNFTIIGKHANGSSPDETVATGVTKAALTAGVTYTVVDTITGGTVTSTGVCTNSVTWLGLGGLVVQPTSTPGPTSTPNGITLYTYYITQFRADSNDFCETDYTATGIIKSEASSISEMLNEMVYDSNDDPYIPNPINGWAFISPVSGEGSITGGLSPKQLIQVSGIGRVDSLALLDCIGGGGGGEL
jgi:hypothetical protein